MKVGVDIRGLCNRNCVYNDSGKCDMFDDISMPDNVDECNNYVEIFDMEEITYISGDLIKLEGRVKVVVNPECFGFRVRDLREDFDTLCTAKEIKPIELTSQFLEDNGWLKVEDRFNTGYQHPKDWRLQLQIVGNKFVAYLHDELLRKIEYVHQLQHLLFGLELNSELKV